MRRVLSILLVVYVFALVQCQAKDNKSGTFVKIVTTEGIIKVRLYDDTPEHKENFLQLVRNKTYEGLLFHRVIKDFMLQAGDPESKNADRTKSLGSGTLGYTLPAEIVFPKYYHKKGALAAARKSDNVNPKKESSSSQFYIVTGKTFTDDDLNRFEQRINYLQKPVEKFQYSEEQRNMYKTFGGAPHLDGDYTVFGEVVKGFDVLDKIQKKKTDDRDRPLEDVKIIKMKIVKR